MRSSGQGASVRLLGCSFKAPRRPLCASRAPARAQRRAKTAKDQRLRRRLAAPLSRSFAMRGRSSAAAHRPCRGPSVPEPLSAASPCCRSRRVLLPLRHRLPERGSRSCRRAGRYLSFRAAPALTTRHAPDLAAAGTLGRSGRGMRAARENRGRGPTRAARRSREQQRGRGSSPAAAPAIPRLAKAPLATPAPLAAAAPVQARPRRRTASKPRQKGHAAGAERAMQEQRCRSP
jgi:hypothetical protein